MKLRVAAVLFVSAVLYGVSIMMSGAPLRVHLFDAAGMLLAFTVPNLVLVRVERKKLAWTITLAVQVLATMAWCFFLPLVIVKAEPIGAITAMLFILSLAAFVVHFSLAHLVGRGAALCFSPRTSQPPDPTSGLATGHGSS